MSLLELAFLLDKMKDGFNSVLPILSLLIHIATSPFLEYEGFTVLLLLDASLHVENSFW